MNYFFPSKNSQFIFTIKKNSSAYWREYTHSPITEFDFLLCFFGESAKLLMNRLKKMLTVKLLIVILYLLLMPQYFTCSCCFIKKRRGEIRNETIYFECNINLKSNENTDRSDVKNKHENLNSEKYGHIFFFASCKHRYIIFSWFNFAKRM